MYWRLRKKLLEYFRRRRPLDSYDKSVNKVIAYRFLYYIVGWSSLGAAVFHFSFIRKDPQSGIQVFVPPSRVSMWDLGVSQPFDVYPLSGPHQFQKIQINPNDDFDDD